MLTMFILFTQFTFPRNLQSVTTTNADRFLVTVLCILGECEDPDELARAMFRAKTEWIVGLRPLWACEVAFALGLDRRTTNRKA